MNIETKTVKNDVTEYEKFGWKHTEDASRGTGPCHRTVKILARDKDMKNYQKIKALEDKYFSLKTQKRTYNPVDPSICIILFILFLIPGFIYVYYKDKQKQSIEYENKRIQSQMDLILKQVKPLLVK